MIGDFAHTLSMLNDRLGKLARPGYELERQRESRARMAADFAEFRDDRSSESIRPQKVLWDTRQAMGADDILIADVGAHKMWIARYYQCNEPNTCLIPNGFCSMGFALPGAIVASLVHQDRKILAISGDAGFLMNLQEMETASRLGSNSVAMVWEDHA